MRSSKLLKMRKLRRTRDGNWHALFMHISRIGCTVKPIFSENLLPLLLVCLWGAFDDRLQLFLIFSLLGKFYAVGFQFTVPFVSSFVKSILHASLMFKRVFACSHTRSQNRKARLQDDACQLNILFCLI